MRHEEPYTTSEHDEAVEIGGCVLLVATIALVVGACVVLML